MIILTLSLAALATSPCEGGDSITGVSPVPGSVVGADAQVWTTWIAGRCDGADGFNSWFELSLRHPSTGVDLTLTGAADYPLHSIDPGGLAPGEWVLEHEGELRDWGGTFVVLDGPTPLALAPTADAVSFEWDYRFQGDGWRTGRLMVSIAVDGPGAMPFGSRWEAHTDDGELVHQGIQGLERSGLVRRNMPTVPFKLPRGDNPVCVRITPFNAAGIAGEPSDLMCTDKPEGCGCQAAPTGPASAVLGLGVVTLWFRRRRPGHSSVCRERRTVGCGGC